VVCEELRELFDDDVCVCLLAGGEVEAELVFFTVSSLSLNSS